MSDTQDNLRRSTAKEEVAEWWRKLTTAFPSSGEMLVHAGYVGSMTSITKEVCEVWTTSSENAAAIREIETNQTQFANFHCSIHGEPISNVPSWESRLSCGKVKHYLENCGVTILRAVLHSNLAEVAGYISGNVKIDPDTHARFLHVNHITVLPQHRNTGIGRMLWEAFLLYFEGQEPSITKEVQLEVYLKNNVARNWYEKLGFEDANAKEGCRSMKRCCKEDALVVTLKSRPVAKACQRLPELLRQLRPHLDVLSWGGIVSRLEDQAQNLLNFAASTSSKQRGAVELGGKFTGSWQIRVNGNSNMWGRAFVGPLGLGFFDIKVPEASHLQAIRIDGVGGPACGTFKVNNATLAQFEEGKLEWKWSRTGRSVWTRDTDVKSPLPLVPPRKGATIVDEFYRTVDLLRTCVIATRNELLWPIENVFDEEVKVWLRILLEPRVRLPKAKLQETEAKLDRLERKYGGADFLKRNSSEMSESSEPGVEIKKTGIKRFRSLNLVLPVMEEPVGV